MNGKCSSCGNELEKDFKFCSECGEKIPVTQEIEEIKPILNETNKSQKPRKKIAPKRYIKNIPKPFVAAIIVIGILVISVAGVVIVSPFDITGSLASSENRSFSIDIRNKCADDAVCYLTVDKLKYCYIGEEGEFNVYGQDSFAVDLVEDAFLFTDSSYDITLYVTAGDAPMQRVTAYDVTEHASFTISDVDGEIIIENSRVR